MDDTAHSADIKRHLKIKRPVTISMIVLVGALMGVWLWYISAHQSMLPSSVTGQIKDFTPYFFKQKVPAGYTFDSSKIKYDSGVLMVTLTKAGSPSIVLTEQVMPTNLKDNDVQQNGETVKNTSDPATINDIEGRMLGTMVASGRKTLVLLNATGDTSKDDLTLLLQGLQPLR